MITAAGAVATAAAVSMNMVSTVHAKSEAGHRNSVNVVINDLDKQLARRGLGSIIVQQPVDVNSYPNVSIGPGYLSLADNQALVDIRSPNCELKTVRITYTTGSAVTDVKDIVDLATYAPNLEDIDFTSYDDLKQALGLDPCKAFQANATH